MLPDFQNIYKNKTFLSRDAQLRLFQQVVKIIKEEVQDPNEWSGQIELHGSLFDILTASERNEVIFTAGDNLTNQLFAAYADQLRNGNVIMTTDLDRSMEFAAIDFIDALKSHLYVIEQEMVKKFTMMVFPWYVLRENAGEWLVFLESILAFRGKIILYGCEQNVDFTDAFTLVNEYELARATYIKVLQTNRNLVPDKKLQHAMDKLKELKEQLIIYTQESQNCSNADLDAYIRLAQEIEDGIVKKQEELPFSGIKYQINEIKNVLLDLRYCREDDIRYFKEVLKNELELLEKEQEKVLL